MSQMNFNLDSKPKKLVQSKPKVVTVSELNRNIKRLIEGEFTSVWLQGEISNFTAHSSGHFYFSLKDKNSQISAVMFRGANSRLKFKPKAGMEVLIRAKVTVYEPRGNYQVLCEHMEPLGAGALQMEFEQLKIKLASEGLFDKEHKKELPEYPKTIALVTSPTGAAVKDMLQVLERRYKGLEIIVVPVLTQGKTAAPSIIEGLNKANRIKKVDLIITGRGGGSKEDMWCFNDEALARTIAASKKPIISAVGHEIDFTIADFELAVKNSDELLAEVNGLKSQMSYAMKSILQKCKLKVNQTSKRLVDPKRKLQDLMQRADELSLRLERAVGRTLARKKEKIQSLDRLDKIVLRLVETKKQNLKSLMGLLGSLSPLNVLERGYAISSNEEGQVITNSSQLKKDQNLDLRLFKGSAKVKVISTKK